MSCLPVSPSDAPSAAAAGGRLLRPQSIDGKPLPEVARLLRRHFSPNVLRVVGPDHAFRAELAVADLDAIRMSTLAYHAEVELEVETSDDHVLVTTQLAGSESVRSHGRTATGGIGFVVVDSTPAPVTKRFSVDSRRVNLRFDREALDALWRSANGSRVPPPRAFAPFVDDDAASRRWWTHVQQLLAYAESPPEPVHGRRMLARIEESLMLCLLFEHRHDASDALAAAAPTAGDRCLERADAYIREHLREPLRLADIASAAGVSIRTLTATFRARRDVSPAKYVEGLRLDAADALLRRRDQRVATVATELGFANLGRFAAAYRRRFGRTPSAARATR